MPTSDHNPKKDAKEELNTEQPLSEKDEVKQAEQRTQQNHKDNETKKNSSDQDEE
jgi:hypothetical protein